MSLNESSVTPSCTTNCTMQGSSHAIPFWGTNDRRHCQKPPPATSVLCVFTMKVVITGGLGFLGQVRWYCGRGLVPCVSHARKRANRKGLRALLHAVFFTSPCTMKTQKHSLLTSCMSAHTRNDVHLEGWSTSPGQGCLILAKV